MTQNNKKQSKQSQKDKFKATAKEHGCDEKNDLSKVLKKISKTKKK